MKSQCPHKYGPLNVATAADSGLGVGLSSSIVCGCAPGPGSRDTDTGCCHSQHFYRLIASVRWVVTTFHHPPADHCSLVVGPCSTRLTHHLAHIWLYSNDPSTMPLLTLPFYTYLMIFFSAALLAGEQLAWRRGPRLDNDEIKFQK